MAGPKSKGKSSTSKETLSKTGAGGAGSRSRQGVSHNSSSKRNVTGGASGTNSGGAAIQVILNGKNMTPQPLMKHNQQTDERMSGAEGGSSSKEAINAINRSGGGEGGRPPRGPAPGEDTDKLAPLQPNASSSKLTQKKSSASLGGAKADDHPLSHTSSSARLLHGHHHDEDELQLPPGMTKDDLVKPVTFALTESATETLLHIPSICVANEFKDIDKIKAANEKYKALCAERETSDKFVDRPAQTINLQLKDKQVLAAPPPTRDVGCSAETWSIYDAYAAENAGATGDDPLDAMTAATKGASTSTKDAGRLFKQVEEIVTVALSSPGCLLEVSEGTVKPPPAQPRQGLVKRGADAKGAEDAAAGGDEGKTDVDSFGAEMVEETDTGADGGAGEQTSEIILAAQQAERILNSTDLETSLNLVERAVQQNLFHEKQLRYRECPVGDEALLAVTSTANGAAGGDAAAAAPVNLDAALGEGGSEQQSLTTNGAVKPNLKNLFTFECEFTAGRTVTSMVWNRVNKDILAVGYGEFQSSENAGGLVLFWSLRNPQFPERVLDIPSGVTAVDFSSKMPNLLAVGMYDGTVAIYNLRKDQSDLKAPVLESGNLPGKHMDPVWQVKWIDKGPERGETLVSISTDGRVVEWSMKKGLSSHSLMVLKRIGNSDGIISRQASGLSFDFPQGDSSMYYAGTEDGYIHRCSCSYNEQYLDTYTGHTGPVYRIRCSPFYPTAFLSCSADWTVKLWTHDQQEFVQQFHSVDLSDVVHDIAWSPTTSTIFGSVTGDGRVEIWDLSVSMLDPVVCLFSDGTKNNTLEFDDEPEDKGVDCPAQTAILFSDTEPVLAVGDETGAVRVYQIGGLNLTPDLPAQAQIDRLKECMA